ncbi:MAG: asparagine synthase-related protein [Pseudomonadota bacterium]
MTAMRYLAVLTPGAGAPAVRRRAIELHPETAGWHVVRDTPGLLIVAKGPVLPVVSETGSGVVLGDLYERGGRAAMPAVAAPEQAAIAASRGQRLIELYWGSYVVFLAAPADARIDVVRAPFGDLGCLIARTGRATLIASDMTLLATLLDRAPEIDWHQVARHLVLGDAGSRATCLTDIDALRGGERLTVTDDREATMLWSPWTRTAALPVGDRQEAAARLRDAVRMSVRARLSSFSHPLLMLSGGLDSTILASCLALDGKSFTCLNLVSVDASGDERHYAQAAATAFGAPCIEAYRQPANVDLALSGAAALPWPLIRSFVQDSALIATDTAARLGADVVIDGGGGDNIFCALQSVAPLADALLAGEPFGRVRAIARSIAELAEVAEWTVLRRAAHRAWFRRDAFRTASDTSLLTPAAMLATETASAHPWLADTRGKAPGRAAYVALLAIAQAWVEGQDATRSPLTLSPLVAQPVVELGLRIPSWFWFEGGGNRAVARAAFADVLPPIIGARQSKATPDSFVLELFERNRTRIRELLCDGLLADQDLIDLPLIERILGDPRPAQGHLPQRIMRLVDVETWARTWMPSRVG